MIVKCPHCGKKVSVNGLGRKPLNIPLKNVLESLQVHHSVTAAAQELGCSPSYLFGVLKANGLKLKEVIKKGK
jgi:AraC-like DNA-binding protein